MDHTFILTLYHFKIATLSGKYIFTFMNKHDKTCTPSGQHVDTWTTRSYLHYTTSKLPPRLAYTYSFMPADRKPCSYSARFCKRTFGGHDGVGWGGMFYFIRYLLPRCRDLWCCCYGVCTKGWGGGGMLTFLLLRTLYVATLLRSLVLLLRYMLLRCRDLWWCCYVICCYAAGISGVVATVCTRRGGVGGHVNVPATSYVICCYAAEISGVVATLYVATLQRSLVLLLRCVHEGVGWGGAG